MKRLHFLLFALLLTTSYKNKDSFSTITITSNKLPFIEVIHPLEDAILWAIKRDTIYPDKLGNFTFKKEISIPELVYLRINDKTLKAILFPNSTIKLVQTDSSTTFDGKNKEGLKLLNKIKTLYFYEQIKGYDSCSTAEQIEQKIQLEKSIDLEKVLNLQTTNQIDEQFEEVLQDEINYLYAFKTQQIIFQKQGWDKPLDKDLMNLFDKTSKAYPIQKDYKPSVWLDYAKNIILQKKVHELSADTSNNILAEELFKDDDWITFYFNIINKYEEKSVTEKLSAEFILHNAAQQHFEKQLLVVFEDFKKLYPNSAYTPFMFPDIQKIEQYHQKIKEEMPTNVEFIDGEEIGSLNELATKLKGNKYYVDVWASWCRPCKEQFKFNDSLDVLLKAKNYKKLYISIDRLEYTEKWQQQIKYYNLVGKHIRASRAFIDDFTKNHSGLDGLAVPQYLIIDENGTIITNNAPAPSDLEELRKILH